MERCSPIDKFLYFWQKNFISKLGWYEDNWYEVNLEAENITCTREQMKMAAEGHITTEALMWNQNVEEKTISGMSSGDFRYLFINRNVKCLFVVD